MLSAFVLVCSLSITPDLKDCDRTTAVGVLKVPEDIAVPNQCLMMGAAYLAQTEMGRQLSQDERVKVLCLPVGKIKTAARG